MLLHNNKLLELSNIMFESSVSSNIMLESSNIMIESSNIMIEQSNNATKSQPDKVYGCRFEYVRG